MAQDKKKKTQQTMTDPMLEGTGQPGELANTPVVRSDMQDPTLLGTGQPGELYGTPTVADPEFAYAMKQAQLNSRIKAGTKLNLLDVLWDMNLGISPFQNAKSLMNKLTKRGE